MQDLVLSYYRLGPGSSQRELVATLTSSASFQLQHALRDLKHLIERSYPELPAGVYEVELTFESNLPTLSVQLPEGKTVKRSYAARALRGQELLESQRPDLLKGKPDIVYVASLANEPQPRRQLTIKLDAPTAASELTVTIEHYPELVETVDLDDLWCVGACRGLPTDVPVVIDRALLEELGRDEAAQSGEFVERGSFLAGCVARNGHGGDLVILVRDAIRAEGTVGTAGTLVWTADTKTRLSQELERRSQSDGMERLVGWQHSHDLSALVEQKPGGEETDDRGPQGSSTDARFFSQFDVVMHKRDFSPLSVALVLDANRAREDPSDIPRCFAAFGTIGGATVRRCFYVGPARALQLKSYEQSRSEHRNSASATRPSQLENRSPRAGDLEPCAPASQRKNRNPKGKPSSCSSCNASLSGGKEATS
jgi:hypothetical protein